MTNQNIAKFGVKLASNLLKLGDGIEVEFRNKDFFSFPEIHGICIRDIYTIVFNNDWLSDAKQEEILVCAFHETRHAYQKACTQFPQIAIMESKNMVEKWKVEFNEYKEPTGEISNINDKEYFNQESEVDAMAFSYCLIYELLKLKIDIPEFIKEKVNNRVEQIMNNIEKEVKKFI